MLNPTGPERRIRLATFTVAAGAAVCTVCCILPIAIPALALAGMGSVFAGLARVSIWFTGLAIAATASAWIWIARQTIRSRARPAPVTLYLVTAATLLVTVAVLWPFIEPHIRRALRI